MIVIDSSAVIAILRMEPEATLFARIIAESDGCLMSSVSVLESSMVLAGRHGDVVSWMELDRLIARAGVRVVSHDGELTEGARVAFLRYGKGRHPAKLNLGDCASYALAKRLGLSLLFKGDDFSKTDLVAATDWHSPQF